MSTPEGDELNRLNLKVAEACGWRACDYPHPLAASMWYHADSPLCPDGGYIDVDELPRWVESLDAAAELRKGLSHEEQQAYMQALDDATYHPGESWWNIVNATAAQHCRAFLAAKGVA